MNERAEERAPVRERGRKTKETKEASAEGWTVVEGGNEETNKKAELLLFRTLPGVPTEKVNATDSEDQPP